MECGAYRDAAGLAEAWIELVQGPWRRATFVLNQPLPYAAAVASLDELLARLQELTNDQAGRLAIARAHDHVAHVAPDLPARVVGR